MESIRGKRSCEIGADEIATLARAHAEVLVDLGTGDGRFVRHMALARPDRLAIGVDACRENLRPISRVAPRNALYIIANVLDLPEVESGWLEPESSCLEPENGWPNAGFTAAAHHITVNFPWGSLLRGLLDGETSLLRGIRNIAVPDALLEVRLNAGALAEEGWTLDQGAGRISAVLSDAGFEYARGAEIDRQSLRSLPSTWAKRIAFGRDARAVHVTSRTPRPRRCRAPPLRWQSLADSRQRVEATCRHPCPPKSVYFWGSAGVCKWPLLDRCVELWHPAGAERSV
jgi:16S rRNA (adenine(1408)-N(1))-methyltransferase